MTTAEQAQVPLWQDRIVKDPMILGGKPIVKGTRISVELITNQLEHGGTVAYIISDYPHITPEDVEACRQYKATGAKLSYTTWAMQDALMDGEITAEEFEALKKEQITWEELHTLKGGGVTWAQLDALREGKITWTQLDDLRAGKITWEELDAAMGGRYKMIWQNGESSSSLQ